MIELFPAIDLRAGRAVRLTQGDYGQETVYGDDPVSIAVSFAQAGATWIHVVDLDAARTGDPINRPVVGAISRAVNATARVQAGGGVRAVDDALALADAGVARVVMGSSAVRDPALVSAVARFLPVAVGLDHRDGELAVHGWTEGSGVRLADALDRYGDASAFVITDIGRDGMLSGPDIDGLRLAAASTPTPIIASGGVASLDDVRALARLGTLAGVICGKAIYEGCFTVAAAITALHETVAS